MKNRNSQLADGMFFLLLFVCFNLASTASAVIISGSGVVFQGATVVDSYNSADPAKSTDGHYDPTKAGNNAAIHVTGDDLFLPNGRVYGHVHVRFGVSLGADSGIGTYAWLAANSGIEPGYFDDQAIEPAIAKVVFPFADGVIPAGGDFSRQTNVSLIIIANVVNSQTPPPAIQPGQQIVCSTNLQWVHSTVYPGPQMNLSTNTTPVIISTNKTVMVTGTNYVCGTTAYNGNSLPTNVCSYTLTQTQGNPPKYRFTLIVGTNYTYATNYTYIWATNYVYTYLQYLYNYTIYDSGASYQTNHYDHVACGDYYVPTNGLTGKTIVTGVSRIVMPDGLEMGNGDEITIVSGASLALYVGGTKCVLNIPAITNVDGLPSRLLIYCSNTVNTLEMNGPGSFSGVVIAPQAYMSTGSSGGGVLDFSGALVVDYANFARDLDFHFDEQTAQFIFPPQLSSPGVDRNRFKFTVTGAVGLSCVVEASTNMLDWFPIATNVAPFLFYDGGTVADGQKFYRFAWP